MAFNFSVFKTRALTAAIFVVVMLLGVWWHAWSFIILFIIIHLGCWWEYIKLIKKISPQNYAPHLLLGLVYITLPIVLIIDLRLMKNIVSAEDIWNKSFDISQVIIPTGIIFSIWINDTMAYIVGSFIGKTPFSKISPKKTWEGTIGGAILCVVTIALIGFSLNYYDLFDWIVIAALCAIAGTAGDLFESKLKRLADVKDSGSIMPGHGGFLDRFDSLLFAVPVVWVYVTLIT